MEPSEINSYSSRLHETIASMETLLPALVLAHVAEFVPDDARRDGRVHAALVVVGALLIYRMSLLSIGCLFNVGAVV